MKGIYSILIFAAFTVAMWYTFAGYMIYQLGKSMGVWDFLHYYITKWILWRYGLGQ